MAHQWPQPSRQDREVAALQLGRKPRGFVGVARRCCHGFPQVIVGAPLVAAAETIQIFPTVFWLSCPHLNRQIGRLESAGGVGLLQRRFENDPVWADELRRAHRDYRRIRRQLVDPQQWEHLSGHYPGKYRVLAESGVGGIRDDSGIKCLHTHAAHSLAGGENPVGRWTIKRMIDLDGCPSGHCQKELNGCAAGCD